MAYRPLGEPFNLYVNRFMSVQDNLLHALRTWQRLPSKALTDRLGISRATLMRAVHGLGPAVVSGGKARRTTYAACRPVRGKLEPLPLYRIDEAGMAHEVALLYPTYPQGCMLDDMSRVVWPLDEAMQDGWFEGLPYMLDDMCPQGFLGRHFASQNADLLQVSSDPTQWSEDDTLYALSLLGSDQSGDLILGEVALRRWLAPTQHGPEPVLESALLPTYLRLAEQAMAAGSAGSSAGGEFPKFTACRQMADDTRHVIVKFSGLDESPGTVRWSDLLVCEHLALQTISEHLNMAASVSHVHQGGGRTFLEVERFDRHGRLGRSPVCSWSALNAARVGMGGKPWPQGVAGLLKLGLIDADTHAQVLRLWWFGRLIANTDMHDGNLTFRPGLKLAPVYDMLPMGYAPVRGMELAHRDFAAAMPLPAERDAWLQAAHAAMRFWTSASQDGRISASFRAVCAMNADTLDKAARF